MKCPHCGGAARVVLTRSKPGLTRRRFKCITDPKHTFSTVEQVVKDYERVEPKEPL